MVHFGYVIVKTKQLVDGIITQRTVPFDFIVHILNVSSDTLRIFKDMVTGGTREQETQVFGIHVILQVVSTGFIIFAFCAPVIPSA